MFYIKYYVLITVPDEAVNSSSIYERKAYSASITWPSIENKNGFTLGYKVRFFKKISRSNFNL